MEFSEVLAKRRSVRHFNTKLDVSDEDIRALLEAAVAAPTAGNIQPWRFTVVRSLEARERLAEALHQRWATAAPVVIVVSVDPRPCCGALRRARRAALRDPGHARRPSRTSCSPPSTAGWRRAGSARSTPTRCARRSASRRPITPVADPAGRLLGRVGRASGAAPARRGHDLAVEEGDAVPGLGCTSARGAPRRSSATATAARSGDTRTTLVFGVGDPHARVMFIGEAPGKNEDLKGEPFVGAAGKLLDELLAQRGPRRATRSTSPTCSSAGRRATATRSPIEIETCTPFLREQIRLIDPEVIVTLGNFATKFVLKTDAGITRLRGTLQHGGTVHGPADLPPGRRALRPHASETRCSTTSTRCASCSSTLGRRSRPTTSRTSDAPSSAEQATLF